MTTSSLDSPPVEGGVIRIRSVWKTFPGTVALRGLDLTLRPGEVHALLGANGSGKSTLVKILSGYQNADAGAEVTVGERGLQLGSPRASFLAGLRFVHQDLALVDTMSVADNVLLTSGWPTRLGAISSRRAHAEVRAAIDELGADIATDALVGSLSPAMKTIVAVARALRRGGSDGSDIAALILDEPTATLPPSEVAVIAQVIRGVARQGTAVVIISHHLQEALDLADVVTVLRDGVKVLTAPAASLTRQSVIAAMLGEDYEQHSADLEAARSVSQDVVLRCENLVSPAFVDVSFALHRGEIVGVAGLEGSGRDDLLPVIFGAQARFGGRVFVDGQAVAASNVRSSLSAGLAYLPADRPRSAAFPELTGRENLTISDLRSLSRPGRIDRAGERREAKEWFERVAVRPQGATESRLAVFSGGNQQKIMLARCMRRKPAVLLLDEPTHGIDVGSQARLHATLLETVRQESAGILISSSDGEELSAICHRVLIMRRGRIVGELSGAAISPAAIAESTARVGPGERV